MAHLSRRDFLRLIATSGIVLGTGNALAYTTYDGESALPSKIALPPSLMLHSRHRWILPDILDYLLENDYTGIHYADFERALLGYETLPEKPILITIDDLTAVQGQNPVILEYFGAMKDSLVERGIKGSFAHITRPDLAQDDNLWDEFRSWTAHGIAFETHTSNHGFLGQSGMTQADYDAEIITSAAFITEKIGLPARALVTPYGSGYDMDTDTVTPQVITSCEKAGLRFIVGIVNGRAPIRVPINTNDVLYVGRVGPGVNNDVYGAQLEIEFWREEYR
jgi:peptidoglycan/xylan/chitin deacetylase (PgdA/CDA1 family)